MWLSELRAFFFFFSSFPSLVLSSCCHFLWWKMQAVLHSLQWVASDQSNTFLVHWPARHINLTNIFCFFLQANPLFRQLAFHSRQTLNCMETQFFIKAGPDHGEESTRHLCPTNNFRLCFVFFKLTLPYLRFPFNFNLFKFSHLLSQTKKQNISLFLVWTF